ncbi:hypothetical protein, partial [Candidatus Nitrosarchaeum limnium]
GAAGFSTGAAGFSTGAAGFSVDVSCFTLAAISAPNCACGAVAAGTVLEQLVLKRLEHCLEHCRGRMQILHRQLQLQ